MARIKKLSRKEIKSPDEFRKSISKILEFVSDNYTKIVIGVGLIVIIIAAVISINIYREKQVLDANSRFRAAIEHYTAGDNDTALSEFSDVKDSYPDSQISDIALYYMGLISLENGKYDEAIARLNEFLSSESADGMLRDAANYTIGIANFEKGNWQSAVDSFSKLNPEENPYGKQARLLLALAYEKQGKRSEAEKIYQEVLTGLPTHNFTF